jgi:hypothetical protein
MAVASWVILSYLRLVASHNPRAYGPLEEVHSET